MTIRRWVGIAAWLVMTVISFGTTVPPFAHAAAESLENSNSESSLVPRHLGEFEAAVQQAPEVLAAAAELEASLGALDQAQAEGGWRFFGGMNVGRFREQVSADYMRSYERIDLRAGLKYPLLGSRHREQERVESLQADAEEKAWEQELVNQSSLYALRLYYINYWAARNRGQLAELFLQNEETIAQILTDRTAAGHLLESDRREMISVFTLVRRQLAENRLAGRRALSGLALMTGAPVLDFRAAFPVMPQPLIQTADPEEAVLDRHPQLLLLQRKVQEQRRLRELARQNRSDAYVSFYSSLSKETSGAEPGYGVGADLSIELPLQAHQAATARRKAADATLEKCQQELAAARFRIRMEVREALDRRESAERNFTFALQRLAATREHLRENLLRYAYLPGDVIEKVQQSRLEDYRAGLETIDAWVQRLHVQAHLLKLFPDIELEMHGDKTNELEQAYTVYVWESQRLIERFAQPQTFFADLSRLHIHRILLSFTAEQMAALTLPTEIDRWYAFIAALQAGGVRVELLLGEPLWLLPDHRPELLAAIARLTDLPFEGIHLDLEPDQLEGRVPADEDLSELLLDTIREVRKAVALPLGVSIHPRYMDPLRLDGGLGPRLASLGVNEVTLMIYVADPQRVAAIAGPILDQNPKLAISIAQSVEASLAGRGSYADLTCGQLQERMRKLRELLPQKNMRAIVLQSWREYDGMSP